MFFEFFLAAFIAFSSLILAIFAASTEFVYATDPRIQYEPPLSDPVWSNFTNQDPSLGTSICVEANDSIATASLEFYGTSILLHGVVRANYSQLLVVLDGEAFSTPTVSETGVEVAAFPIGSILDPTIAHRVTIQKSFNASPSDSWNLLLFSIGNSSEPTTASLVTDSSFPEPSTATVPSHPTTGAPVENAQERSKRSKPVIIGVIAGILAVIGCSILAFIFLYRRHRRVRSVLPVDNPYSTTLEQSSPRILMSYKRLRVSLGRRIGRHESTVATVGTNEDVDGSLIRQTPEANTNEADGRTRSPDDQQGRLLISQSPTPVISNDPFRDPEISETTRSASHVVTVGSSLSRDPSLPSISPPPSYRTTNT